MSVAVVPMCLLSPLLVELPVVT